MKTITYEQFLKFKPCWLRDGRSAKLAQIGARKEHWTAVDILKLRGVEPKDKFWAVFEAELVSDPIAHEFACRCAERALNAAGVKDDGNNASWNAIHTKRRWLKGEATDDELAAAGAAARDAARAAVWAAARDAAWAAAEAAWAAARAAAWAAAREAAREAAWAAWAAAWAAARDAAWAAARDAAWAAARDAAWAAEIDWQNDELLKMLGEEGWDGE